MLDADEVWRAIGAQRAALADVLESLTPREWERDSLCAGWTVRDVAAHVISTPQTSVGQYAAAVVRARGNFNRCMFQEAKRWSARPTELIVADYRRLDGSRKHPPGLSPLDPLVDVLVHTQDIVRPLGREHPMPAQPSAAAASHVWRHRSFPFGARKRLGGYRLTATDVQWSVGEGAAVQGSMGAILLLLTGRTVSLPELSGVGAGQLIQTRQRSITGRPADPSR